MFRRRSTLGKGFESVERTRPLGTHSSRHVLQRVVQGDAGGKAGGKKKDKLTQKEIGQKKRESEENQSSCTLST